MCRLYIPRRTNAEQVLPLSVCIPIQRNTVDVPNAIRSAIPATTTHTTRITRRCIRPGSICAVPSGPRTCHRVALRGNAAIASAKAATTSGTTLETSANGVEGNQR